MSIIVPARNEEEIIEQALNTLLALDYDNYEVIAVNDRSTDSTGEIMERIAENPHFLAKTREMGHPKFRSFRVVHHSELPAGWLGKNARHVDGGEPGDRRLAALYRCGRAVQTGFTAACVWLMRSRCRRIMSCCFRG